MSFLFGRMAMDSPLQWSEQMGDPVTNVGGAPVPAVRSALRHAVDVPTFTRPVGEDSLARRQRLRRQLRSLLNNTVYKMQGVFLIWDDDTEQNGWYIPDQGQLAAGADSPLTHGYFKLENFVWFKAGAPRTHRPAVGLYLKDTRGGLWARDILRRVYNTDFSALTNAFSLTYLPAGAQDVIDAVLLNPLGQSSTNIRKLPAGRDGGQNIAIENGSIEPLLDLGVLSYERPEADRNLGDVVIYDQRGIGGIVSNYVLNPSFEHDTIAGAPAVWSATIPAWFLNTGSTRAVREGGVVGLNHLEIATTNALAFEGTVLNMGTLPAGTYTFSVYLKGGTGGEKMQLCAGQANATGMIVSIANLTTAYTRYSATFTTDGTGACYVGVRTATATAVTVFMDAAQVTLGTTVVTYEDGDLAGYNWTGTFGNSTSVTSNLPEMSGNTNFVPDPNFEYDTTGTAPAVWGATLANAATLRTEGSGGVEGGKCMKITTPGSLVNEGAGFPSVPMVASQVYRADVWLKGNAGGELVQIVVGSSGSGGAKATNIALTTQWVRYGVTFIAGEVVSGNVCMSIRTQGTSAYTFFADRAQLTVGNSAQVGYFDGDTNGYLWAGTPGNAVTVIDPQQFGWEEVYGPDYPLTSGSTPVLDNGFVRVVYDPTHLPGFFVYTWNGREFVLQGKVNVANELLQSANIKEYTPERAVIEAVFTAAGGTQRAMVFITLQRGWSGPRFEVYGAAGLTQAVSWTWSAIGINTSFAKFDSAVFGGVINATAGTGTAHIATGVLGADSFGFENCVLGLTQGIPGAMQLNTASVIANVKVSCGFGESAIGAPANGFSAVEQSTSSLYASLHLSFSQQQTDQIMEAENMTLAAGTTSVVDAGASEGKAAKGTRTAEALHVSRAEWPNKYNGVFRVFARVRVIGGKLNIRAGVGGGFNATQSNASTTYTWMDLGDASAFPVSPLEVRMWGTAGPGAFPSPAATDTFKRVAESPLSNLGKWSTITGAADTGNISAEEWHSDSFPTISGARWNVAEQTNPAVSLEVTLLPASSERYIGVWACLAAIAKSGYFGRWEEEAVAGKFKVTIERWNAGVKTILATFTNQTLIAKDSIGIAVRGGVVGVYRKTGGVWSQIGQAADSTYTKGYTGIEGSGSNGGYNNFAFAEVPAAGTTEFWLDRIEAFLMEDNGENPFTGARDFCRSILFDSRVNPTVVTRS